MNTVISYFHFVTDCRLTFLVWFADPNTQLFNVKSVFIFLNCGFSLQKIYIFITFLGIKKLFLLNSAH